MPSVESSFTDTQVRHLLRLSRRLRGVESIDRRQQQLLGALCRATGAVTGYGMLLDDSLRPVGEINTVRLPGPATQVKIESRESLEFSGELSDRSVMAAQIVEPCAISQTQHRPTVIAEAGHLFSKDNPMTEPFLRAFTGRNMEPTAVARRQGVTDSRWYKSDYFDHFRRQAGLDDCIVSVVPLPGSTPFLAAVCLSKAPDQPGAQASQFSERDSVAAELIHSEMRWVYLPNRSKAYEEPLAPEPALPQIDVAPRLQRVLYRMLSGDSEKEAAKRLGLSQHTIHEYVRALYRQLDVTSRGELMAKFISPDAMKS